MQNGAVRTRGNLTQSLLSHEAGQQPETVGPLPFSLPCVALNGGSAGQALDPFTELITLNSVGRKKLYNWHCSPFFFKYRQQLREMI